MFIHVIVTFSWPVTLSFCIGHPGASTAYKIAHRYSNWWLSKICSVIGQLRGVGISGGSGRTIYSCQIVTMALVNILKIEILPSSCTFSSDIVRVIKSRSMELVGTLVCGEGIRIWVRKPEGKRPLRKRNCRWENAPKINLKCVREWTRFISKPEIQWPKQ